MKVMELDVTKRSIWVLLCVHTYVVVSENLETLTHVDLRIIFYKTRIVRAHGSSDNACFCCGWVDLINALILLSVLCSFSEAFDIFNPSYACWLSSLSLKVASMRPKPIWTRLIVCLIKSPQLNLWAKSPLVVGYQ